LCNGITAAGFILLFMGEGSSIKKEGRCVAALIFHFSFSLVIAHITVGNGFAGVVERLAEISIAAAAYAHGAVAGVPAGIELRGRRIGRALDAGLEAADCCFIGGRAAAFGALYQIGNG
jgi:hypothetical protein